MKSLKRLLLIIAVSFICSISGIAQNENSLHFDGLNDKVNLPSGTHAGMTTNGTLEAWIKTSANNSEYRGIVVRSGYYGLFLIDNKLSTFVWGGGAQGATTYNNVTLNDGIWHHVALRFQIGVTNGTQMYLDGQPVGPAITLDVTAASNNFQIGCNTTVQFFNGQIDNVKIYNRALAPSEINDSYNCLSVNSAGLNGSYNFNQGVAVGNNLAITTLSDQSGNNNSATLSNFTLIGSISNWVAGYTCTPNLCPTPAGFANQTLCAGSTVANLIANGQNIQWYSASTGGTVLNSWTPLVNGAIYYASQTTTNCESVARLAVTVTLNAIPSAPTGAGSQNTCAGTVANLTATGSNLQWYDVTSGGTPLASSTLLTNGATYFASQTVSGCESTNRLAVVVTTQTPPPTGLAIKEICTGGGTITVNNIGITGSVIQYYANPSGGTSLPFNTPVVNGTTYYASQTISGCESVNRHAVTVILHNFTSNVTAPNPQSLCNGATVASLVANATPGATISWFTSSTGWQFGGVPLPSNTQLVDNTTYYAGQSLGTNNLCTYVGTAQVQVVLNPTPTPTGLAAQTFCNSATVANLTASGTGVQWYTVSTGGSALATGTILVDGITYYASQTISGCESATRFAAVVTVNVTSSPTGSTTQSVCSGASVADLSASGTNIQWYSTASGGAPLSPSTALADGVTYFASQTVNGCESINRLEVTATVNAISAAPTATASQEFCNGATVADLTATGSGVQWYTAASGGTALTTGTSLASGSYFVSQTLNGCESTDRFEVNVTINAPAAPTGNTAQSFCFSGTVADLQANGQNIQWYNPLIGGGTTPLNPGDALVDGFAYQATQTVDGCESQNQFVVTVDIITFSNGVNLNGATLTAAATGATYQWIDCDANNAAINGATAQTFTPAQNGNYAVVITVNGCSDTSTCVAITTVGLDEDKLDLLTIQPNPTSGLLMITVSQPTNAVVSAANGTVIAILKLEGETVLDATKFATGVYYLRTSEGQTVKFIKE
jgi:hypothetical protein